MEKIRQLVLEPAKYISKGKQSVERYLEKEGLMMSPKEIASLLWVNLKVCFINLIEFIKVAFNYYDNMKFLKADISLRLMYLFHNPYKISKRFLMNKGAKDIYSYGETPVTSMDLIAKQCHITSKDTLYELGAGRGRNCFWLNTVLGCSVVGIEYIPEFVERADLIVKKLKMEHIKFVLADMLKADLSDATVIYLYGTCFDDSAIKKLAVKFAKLPKGTKIITVSYPLTDYAPSFELMKRFSVPYTWGHADVFLNVVK